MRCTGLDDGVTDFGLAMVEIDGWNRCANAVGWIDASTPMPQPLPRSSLSLLPLFPLSPPLPPPPSLSSSPPPFVIHRSTHPTTSTNLGGRFDFYIHFCGWRYVCFDILSRAELRVWFAVRRRQIVSRIIWTAPTNKRRIADVRRRLGV